MNASMATSGGSSGAHLRAPGSAAFSAALRPLVVGPPMPVRVLAAFPQAAYLQLEGAGQAIMSVVTTEGIVHPNSAILARTHDLRVRAGVTGRIGAGRLLLGDLDVAPSRWWDPRPALSPIAGERLSRNAAELERAVASLADREATRLRLHATLLAGFLRAGDVLAAADAGRRLVGLGPGLTPSGDDVLSGLFVAAIALRHAVTDPGEPASPAFASASPAARDAARSPVDHPDRAAATLHLVADLLVGAARDATTAVSYALLWHAARGHAAGPVADLLRALAGCGSVAQRLPELLAVGATSGRDLAIGLAIGARLAVDLAGTDTPCRTTPTSPTDGRPVSAAAPTSPEGERDG